MLWGVQPRLLASARRARSERRYSNPTCPGETRSAWASAILPPAASCAPPSLTPWRYRRGVSELAGALAEAPQEAARAALLHSRAQGARRAPGARGAHGVAGPHLTSAAAGAASRPRTSSIRLGGCMVASAGSERSAAGRALIAGMTAHLAESADRTVCTRAGHAGRGRRARGGAWAGRSGRAPAGPAHGARGRARRLQPFSSPRGAGGAIQAPACTQAWDSGHWQLGSPRSPKLRRRSRLAGCAPHKASQPFPGLCSTFLPPPHCTCCRTRPVRPSLFLSNSSSTLGIVRTSSSVSNCPQVPPSTSPEQHPPDPTLGPPSSGGPLSLPGPISKDAAQWDQIRSQVSHLEPPGSVIFTSLGRVSPSLGPVLLRPQ